MDNKKIKYITIGIVVLFVIIIIVLLLRGNEKEYIDLRLYEVDYNTKIEDVDGMTLYNRYQVEDGLLFNFVGSNGFDDYYGYFYKENIKELPSLLKNIIAIKDGDYGSWSYDVNKSCYRLSLDDFKNLYNKLYGEEEVDLTFENIESEIIVENDSICVTDSVRKNYTKVVDTYLVDIVRENDKIIIYEKVIFIDIKDDYLYFYKDQGHKELIYKLKRSPNLDTSFINNSEIVSNVLLEYQGKLDTYEYTYIKGIDTYYLESIKK